MTKIDRDHTFYARLASFLAVVALLSSCQSAEFKKPIVSIKSVTASECLNECSTLHIEFKVQNLSNDPICFPARYITGSISRSVFILENKKLVDFQVIYDPVDSVNATPDLYDKHVKMLRGEPNIIVQPNSTLEYEVSTGNKYKIPNRTLTARFELFYYPCDEAKYKQYGFFHFFPETKINYEPFKAQQFDAESAIGSATSVEEPPKRN